MKQDEITPHLFRIEYGKIVAVLYKTFHLKQFEIAEDIASETFLKASESWALHGIPENPTAWLYTVAKNKTKDYFKHLTVFETQIQKKLAVERSEVQYDFEFTHETISDSQLATIFSVCDPVNSVQAQICLALQILCGFSVEEIANAFLTKSEAIKKRLQRARTNLREGHFQLKSLNDSEIGMRLDSVLKTLYLFFNEGYFSKTNNQPIRKELCAEAIRLVLILTENKRTNTPQTNALLALMCFQSSRLEARTNKKGEAVLFDEQDKNLWNQSMIEKGNQYLINACEGNEVSKYHLEAAIAYWHTTTTGYNRWQHILQLYNQLILIETSPAIVLNMAFAYAKVYGHEAAIAQIEKLDLPETNHYHGLLGYLHADTNTTKALKHYEKALQLTKSKTERQALTKKILQLKESRSKSTFQVESVSEIEQKWRSSGNKC